MALKRSASGFVSIASVVVVTAVSLVAIVGRGNASSVIDFLHGGAWVSSQAGDRPRLHHVNANGKVDFSALTDSPDLMQVANTEGRAVAVNTGTGVVTVVDLSKAAAQASAPIDDGAALVPVGAAGHLYLVDPGQGTVRTVAAAGPGPLVSDPVEVRPGAPDRALSDRPGVDDDGTLWVSAVSDGIVVPVTSERPDPSSGVAPPPRVGRPVRVADGPERPTGIDVSIVSGTAYVLVRYRDRADVARLRPDDPPKVLASRPGQPLPPNLRIAPRQGDSALVHVLDPVANVVRRLHPERGEVDSVGVPIARGHGVSAPVVAGGRLVFVDSSTGHVVAADPDQPDAEPESHALAPPGSPIEVVVKDGTVVANHPGGNKIVTFDHNGKATESEKFVVAPSVSDLVDKPPTPPIPAGKPTARPAAIPGPATPGTPNPNAPGRGTPSPPGATPPTTARLSPPADPINLQSAGGAGQVVLSWQASPAGGAPAGFVITGPGGTNVQAGPGETSRVVPAPNGTSVTFTIRAENAAGRSGGVAFPPAVPQSQVPGPPTLVRAVPGDGQVSVSWGLAQANGTAIQGYRVQARDGTVADVGATTATAVLKPLTNGVDYAPLTVTALARTSGGAAVVSTPAGLTTPAIPFGKPLAPTGVTVSGQDASLAVSFPAANGNGDPVTVYEVALSPGGPTLRVTPYPGPMSTTFGSLTNGTTYTVTVTATNRAGTGPPSLPTSGVPRTKPSVNLGAATSTETSISLDFTVDGHGSPPDSCWFRLDGGGRQPTSCNNATARNLKPGTAYRFEVGAHNAAGDSLEVPRVIDTKKASAPTKYFETVYSKNPLPTKTWEQTNASGPGPEIKQGTKVEVTCRKRDTTVTSNGGGWWYRIASSPWNDRYWAPAGDFFNGDGSAVDPDVPVC